MASSKKNTNNTGGKKNTATKAEPEGQVNSDKKKQIRLTAGILSLLLGAFICFSIISYYFTWHTDQDKLFNSNSLWQFLLHDKSAVANWGGRLGAVLSHLLVFRGAGIASLAIGLAILALGAHMIYGKRVVPLLRYMRWVSILLLIAAPALAYLSPQSPFPYGGALGNEAVAYMNGFAGSAGTGMILIAAACFFLFVVLALDIRPLLRRMRSAAANAGAAIATARQKNEAEKAVAENIATEEEAEPAAPMMLKEEANGLREWNMTLGEKSSQKTINDTYANEAAVIERHETAILTEEAPEEEYEAEEIEEEEEESAAEETADEEFSFEVIKQEDEPTIKHGEHISLESKEPYAPELDLPSYKFPRLDLLEDRAQEAISLDKEELEKNKNQIIQTLRSFGIEIQRISATVGPTVTLYEIVPAEGVRISKIRNLEDDIALNLAALGIRIIAPIPGRGTIGIEVPNAHKQIVSMKALLASEKFANSKMSLPIALGKKIDNENYIVDLATMPHLLMAGATGQGKSVGINAILVSLLYKKHPSQLKFVMVDPKKVELSIYRTIEKHFLAKLPNEEEAIITDTKKVIYTLNALCIEMDNRYELLKEAGARNIKEYNEKFINRKLNPERGHKYLPFIVLVIDEFADLIMTAGKEVEMPIARLAQLARAIGIHLIIATQRPSVNVITGTIKANFPARIAFKVSAKVDSRTILDAGGAEQLIGRGDMLVSHGSELLRLQCAFVDTPEVENIVEFIGKQRGYPSAFELPEYEGEDGDGADKVLDLTNRDKLFEDCARTVVQTQSGSTSMLQRRYNLGYNRAGRIMDQLEAAGIVGPAVGSKPREVYFKTEAELEQFLNTLD
ncbi:MAG: DNA translocase FtsK 4TM domain-containing protein [Bacteroidetes bacterium]|nr:DNA translocase FtsK 4TM domain-containing protein [Bacteroidota bacterium]